MEGTMVMGVPLGAGPGQNVTTVVFGGKTTAAVEEDVDLRRTLCGGVSTGMPEMGAVGSDADVVTEPPDT